MKIPIYKNIMPELLNLTGCFIVTMLCIVGCGDSSAQIDYAAMGASDANGIGADPPTHGYVFVIEDGLDSTKGCKGADLKDLGIPGAKSGDIENVELPIAKELNPDLVTLLTGANDLVSGDSTEKFESGLKKILDEMSTKTQAKIFVGNLPNLTLLPTFVKDPDQDVTLARVAAFNVVIARETEAHGATLVDLFSNLPNDPALVSDDGFHPSTEGHKRIGQLFLNAIVPQLCGKP